ncbi:MAG: hypothetical protein ACFFB5_06215 [Promethearchaeota archaeon]
MQKKKNQHIGINKDDFLRNELKQVSDYYNRYGIVVDLYNRYLDYSESELPNIRILRTEAERAYYYGLYSATILAISAAIETSLKTYIDERNFQKLLEKMHTQGYISGELKKRIDYLRKNTYNVLKHTQSMGSVFNLGWKKEKEEEFSSTYFFFLEAALMARALKSCCFPERSAAL